MTAPPIPQTRNQRPFLKGLGLALCVVVPIVVVTATSGADPETAGQRAGALAVPPILAGLAVGIWAKVAMRRWSMLDYILRFALSTIVFFFFSAFGQGFMKAADRSARRAPAAPLTDAEKQGLYISGGWANHREFGFVLPLGGRWDLVPDIQTEINRQFDSMPGMHAWVMQNQNGDGLVVIYVAKGFGEDEAEFRAMARGISRGVAKQGVAVQEDVVRWSRGAKEFRHSIRVDDGRFAKTRCVPSGSELQPYILCVQTLSPESTGLDNARNYLEIKLRQ